jgi:hypothetical protein
VPENTGPFSDSPCRNRLSSAECGMRNSCHSALRTPHSEHSALRTPHSEHSALHIPHSALRIRNTPHSEHSAFRTPHSEHSAFGTLRIPHWERRPPGRSLFPFAIISRLSSVKLVTPAGYSRAGRSALRHVQPRTSNPADLRSRRGGRRSASHFFRAVPAGAGFRSPEAEGRQRILTARGGAR